MGTDLENDGRSIHRLGIAWILFCCALALHVTDEALTGFLSVYNPTVLALRQQLGFWPMPTFTFQLWLTLLIIGILVLLTLSPLFFRNVPWGRPVAYFCAVVVGIFNAVGHTFATIFGQTVSSVAFPRPAPGFYSSPFLFAAACFLLVQLRRTGSASQTLSQ